MKIRELLDGIRKQDLVLPEFQREYVWKREQSKQLMVSLLKDYPVGGLLFWKTDEPPELKNIDELTEKIGAFQVILDGQQRLTTLYLLVNGEIPPFYLEKDIQYDPRVLYFNIENGDFQYYQATKMKGNPVWFRVIDCFNKQDINVFQIAKEQEEEDATAFELANQYNTNLNKLRNIPNVDLPVQLVPPLASLTEAIDIFDRVNSQGTKLTEADLALTHITGKWSQARREMKSKISELEKQHFYFNLTFMTRALTGVVAKRGLYEYIHDRQRDELINGWKTLTTILDYLIVVLRNDANIHSNWDLNTSNIFVPLIVYLSLQGNRFNNDKSINNAVHWLYASHIKSRYTGQTDQKLENDISIIVRQDSPWEDLLNNIIDQRGRIETKPSDLEGRGSRHPLYSMTYILAKAKEAVDWFNGAPISQPYTKSNWIQSHHIFPTSKLYEQGYDPENHLHKKIVNEIANRAFITAPTNQEISNKLPETYFPEVEERFPGALKNQFIPMDPYLWKIENYPDFLDARRKLIALKVNEFMDNLVSEPEVVHERSIEEIIQLGESATLEFKSTLQWDVVQNMKNKGLRKSVLKTIAAFLNTEGGTLVIGVEDDGSPFGLDQDLNITYNSIDKFSNLLTDLIVNYIGAEFSAHFKIRFENLEGKQICVIDVDQAPIPAYLQGDKGSEFFIRSGATSRLLDAEETVEYINMKWD